jgi:hypothetical protein
LNIYLACSKLVLLLITDHNYYFEIVRRQIEIANNYCHHVILRNAGFAIMLYYHPAEQVVVVVVVVIMVFCLLIILSKGCRFLQQGYLVDRARRLI